MLCVYAQTGKLPKCVALWSAFTLHSFPVHFTHFYTVEDNANMKTDGESLSRFLHSIDGAFPDIAVVLA